MSDNIIHLPPKKRRRPSTLAELLARLERVAEAGENLVEKNELLENELKQLQDEVGHLTRVVEINRESIQLLIRLVLDLE